jgi:hypothetical protein
VKARLHQSSKSDKEEADQNNIDPKHEPEGIDAHNYRIIVSFRDHSTATSILGVKRARQPTSWRPSILGLWPGVRDVEQKEKIRWQEDSAKNTGKSKESVCLPLEIIFSKKGKIAKTITWNKKS